MPRIRAAIGLAQPLKALPNRVPVAEAFLHGLVSWRFSPVAGLPMQRGAASDQPYMGSVREWRCLGELFGSNDPGLIP